MTLCFLPSVILINILMLIKKGNYIVIVILSLVALAVWFNAYNPDNRFGLHNTTKNEILKLPPSVLKKNWDNPNSLYKFCNNKERFREYLFLSTRDDIYGHT